jgi:hypothetical protein
MGFQPMLATHAFGNRTIRMFASSPLAASREPETEPSHRVMRNRERQTVFTRMDRQSRHQVSRHGLEAHVTDAFSDAA